MAQNYFKLEIITPENIIFSDNVVHVNVPGSGGQFGVLVNHIPFIGLLAEGHIKVDAIGETQLFATSGGFVHIANNVMKIVAHTAEKAAHIDIERAQKARSRAIKRLEEKRTETDLKRAAAALSRALNRIKAVEQHH